MQVTFAEPDFSKYGQRPRFSRGSFNQDPLEANNNTTPSSSSFRRGSNNSNGSSLPGSRSTSPFVRRVSFDTISVNAGRPASATSSVSPQVSSSGSAGITSISSVSASLQPLQGDYGSNYTADLLDPSSSASGTASDHTLVIDDVAYDLKHLPSIVVSARHECHKYSVNSRTFLFSITSKHYSLDALKWLQDNLLEDGDELVCLKMFHPQSSNISMNSVRQEAESILHTVLALISPSLKINVVVELGLGKVKEVSRKTMVMYQPALVVVGVGKSAFSNLSRFRYKKNLSSYLIERSPVPVIIVSPALMRSVPSSALTSPDAEISPSPTTVGPQRRKRAYSTGSVYSNDAWPTGPLAYYRMVTAAVNGEGVQLQEPRKNSSSSPVKFDCSRRFSEDPNNLSRSSLSLSSGMSKISRVCSDNHETKRFSWSKLGRAIIPGFRFRRNS